MLNLIYCSKGLTEIFAFVLNHSKQIHKFPEKIEKYHKNFVVFSEMKINVYIENEAGIHEDSF